MLSRFRFSKGVLSPLLDPPLLRSAVDEATAEFVVVFPPLFPRFSVKTADNWVGICNRGSVEPSPLDSWCMDSSRSISVTSASFKRPSLETLLWKKECEKYWFFQSEIHSSTGKVLEDEPRKANGGCFINGCSLIPPLFAGENPAGASTKGSGGGGGGEAELRHSSQSSKNDQN